MRVAACLMSLLLVVLLVLGQSPAKAHTPLHVLHVTGAMSELAGVE